MIKRKSEIEIQIVENKGNIQGIIEKHVILTPEQMSNKALMFAMIELPSGSKIKEHEHFPDAEIYYLLEGEAVVTDNDKTEVLHAGDVVFTGNGDRHSIENRSGIAVKFMAVIFK
jgi:Mannose-6-phosphate isomerase